MPTLVPKSQVPSSMATDPCGAGHSHPPWSVREGSLPPALPAMAIMHDGKHECRILESESPIIPQSVLAGLRRSKKILHGKHGIKLPLLAKPSLSSSNHSDRQSCHSQPTQTTVSTSTMTFSLRVKQVPTPRGSERWKPHRFSPR